MSSAIRIGLILARSPLLLPKPTQFQAQYRSYRDALARQSSIPPSTDFYFKKGTTMESAWLQNQPSEECIGGIARMEALQATELAGIEIINETNDHEIHDLNRKPRNQLYLFVKRDGKWELPSDLLESSEVLRQGATRLLNRLGNAWNTWVVGNVPAGHVDDTFFMKARIFSGQVVEEGVEFAWFAKGEEIEQRLESEYYQRIKDLL